MDNADFKAAGVYIRSDSSSFFTVYLYIYSN